MRIHLIAIGGAVMHNLAIALKQQGHIVSGSDDEIFEPSLSRLAKYGILPEHFGWFPDKITTQTDAVILGMHARADNPELRKAMELQIPVYNFPEYVYEQSKNKLRVAICGSHGKTTITSMVMHCLKQAGIKFDYLVGAMLEGFETMVHLSDAEIIIIEGDEYFASALDRRPKFLFYKPHITLISGIAWDHFNVFPTWDAYVNQFKLLLDNLDETAQVFYHADDGGVAEVVSSTTSNAVFKGYASLQYTVEDASTSIVYDGAKYHFSVFGKHNMQNMSGAKHICNALGISDAIFFTAMQTFQGASKRLEKYYEDAHKIIFRDFAHAPSKVRATVHAVKEQYAQKTIIACLELHTYSSLNKAFMPQYKDSMKLADIRIVYFNPHTLQMKNLDPLTVEEVKQFFADEEINVFNTTTNIISFIKKLNSANSVLLFMSSGNFNNLDFALLT
jgi:UDP-N-acetylmuramate: L-alanyl-gamma-D-glutamyl-meso-diaminopimelate ligase